MSSLDSRFDEAKRSHKAGDVRRAEALYVEVLRDDPSREAAWYLLGVASHALGKWAEAEEALRTALRLVPDHAEAQNHLGTILASLGRMNEAIAAFQDAIRVRPGFAEARSNLARAQRSQSTRARASSLLARGVEARGQGELAEALGYFREAVAIEPGFAEAHKDLGIVLGRLGQLAEAVVSLESALRLRPDFAEAHHALGVAFHLQGRRKEAFSHYIEALRIRPDHVETYSNLGDLYAKEGELDEAVACYRHAIRLDPSSSGAYNNLGSALSELGRFPEAADSFRKAISLAPGFNDAHSNLLKCLNYFPDLDPAMLLDEHRRHVQPLERVRVLGTDPGHDRDPGRPLRVGYVSPDFRAHAVAYFVEPILANHHRSRVEPVCYAEQSTSDAVTARLLGHVPEWRRTTGLSDAEVAGLVRRDRIDILVDLAGHTAHHRLGVFALKPAPVQVTYLGYPNTTGLSTIDYLLTDAVVDPPGESRWSSEALYRLPGVFCCYAPAPDAPEVEPLPALRQGAITFGSLHKLSKLNPQVLDLWFDLLDSIPSSRLLLFRNNLRGKRRDEILEGFSKRGIDRGRVSLRHEVEGGGSHLRVYHEIDVSLDVFPWCGHTTACESLWMGVPVVTLSGDRHAGRMTASVLSVLGLDEWVVTTRDAYLEQVGRRTADLGGLARLRSTLRPRMRGSLLCRGDEWTGGLEDAYRQMWHTWLASSAARP